MIKCMIEQITVTMPVFSVLCAEKRFFHIVDLELVSVARAASGMDRSRPPARKATARCQSLRATGIMD